MDRSCQSRRERNRVAPAGKLHPQKSFSFPRRTPFPSSPEPHRGAGRVTNAALIPLSTPVPAAVGDSGATAPASS